MSAADRGARGLRPLLAEFFDPAADELSGAELSRAVTVVLTSALVITNLIGSAAVLAVTYLVLPLPPVPDVAQVRRLNAIVAAVYIVLAVLAGAAGGRGLLRRLSRWLRSDEPAGRAVQHLVVRAPLFLFRLQVGLWLTAAVVFGVIDAVHSARLGLVIAATVALTGVTTGACAYLVAETGDVLLLTEETRERLSEEPDGLVRRDGVALRGRGEPIALYAL